MHGDDGGNGIARFFMSAPSQGRSSALSCASVKVARMSHRAPLPATPAPRPGGYRSPGGGRLSGPGHLHGEVAPAPLSQCRLSTAAPIQPAIASAARNAMAATRNGTIRSDSARRKPSSSKRGAGARGAKWKDPHPHRIPPGALGQHQCGSRMTIDLCLVVRCDDHRRAKPVQFAQQMDDALRLGGVEAGGRLVGQQQPRAADHGAGDGDPLPLAAGQIVRQRDELSRSGPSSAASP